MKIGFIGAGNLGSCIAFEVANRDIVDEIVIYDIARELTIGQANDIAQCVIFSNNTKVTAGEFSDLADADMLVITAGKPRSPEIKDRLELGKINTKVIKSICEDIKKYCKNPIIITLTNPMDLMNLLIQKETGFDRFRVIGSGGQLDSSRMRIALKENPDDVVDAFVLGEHGQDQVPLFSHVKVNGKSRDYSDDEIAEIRDKIKKIALAVISNKGATVYAPASNTVDMITSIIKNQKKTMICSVLLEGEYGINDVSLGVPVILGTNGVEKIEAWDLNEKENQELKLAAEKLKQTRSEFF